MKDQTKPISEVRQKLPSLAKAAAERMARVVITQQGRPQAVLLGYEDYMGMVTAVELLSRPGLVEGMEQASEELERGEGVALETLKEAVQGYGGNVMQSGGVPRDLRIKVLDVQYSKRARRFGPGEFNQSRLIEIKARTLFHKGNALTQLGRTQEAIASYDEVLGLLSPSGEDFACKPRVKSPGTKLKR